MSDPELYSVKEAAAYLTVSTKTVFRMIRDRQLRAAKMVVGTRIERADLDRYLRANTFTGPGEEPTPPDRWTLYRFYDVEGVLLYVGITGAGASRWTHHSKYQPWWTEVATVRVEHYPSLEAVLAAEGEAIRSENPRYNKAGR